MPCTLVVRDGAHLVLDLHNAFTTARNTGVDVDAYVAGMPLERVIELHVSGGAESDPRWLRSGRVLRLDSHDTPVPDEVAALWKDVPHTMIAADLSRRAAVRTLRQRRLCGP